MNLFNHGRLLRNCSCLTKMALNLRARMFILLYFNNGTHAWYIRRQQPKLCPSFMVMISLVLHDCSVSSLLPRGRGDHRRDMNPPSRGEHDASYHGIWAQLVWGVAVPEKLWVKHYWPFKDLQTKWPKARMHYKTDLSKTLCFLNR